MARKKKVTDSILINAFRFIKGAIAKKDIIEGLTHVTIENGSVRAFNGVMALSSPIPLDLKCKPKAIPFIKALESCDETIHLSLTKAGKLKVQSGKFKVLIECIEDDIPHVTPEGEYFEIDGEKVYNAIKLLYPFVSDDASKPWSNGIKLEGSIAMATNNVIAIQYWTDSHFPYIVNIPRSFADEVLRIKELPIAAQFNGSSITFHYPNNKWIRSNLLSDNWPKFDSLLDIECFLEPIPATLFEGLNVVKPFIDKTNRVFFEDGFLKTHLHDEDEGATYEVEGLTKDFHVFNLIMLQKLEGVAEKIDFNSTTRTAIFHGKGLRGVITRMLK